MDLQILASQSCSLFAFCPIFVAALGSAPLKVVSVANALLTKERDEAQMMQEIAAQIESSDDSDSD